MKKLILLRGAMGVGKSTFIEKNGLKPYTLVADEFRLLLSSPALNESGLFEVSQEISEQAWPMLKQALERRMENGDFVIVDATHTKTSDMQYYKSLVDKYRYRTYVIDFTSIPIEVAKERNLKREEHKIVPEHAIDRAYERFEKYQVPKFIEVVPYTEAEKVISLQPLDFSEWTKIHHIGDIHGCNTALKKYLEEGLKKDELYIFTGDYVDRGIENAEVLNFLIRIMNRPNVILLEGNHEIHLWHWSNNKKSFSQVFESETKIELEKKGVKKSEVRKLYRKLRNLAYYTYGEKTVLVTHGGLPLIPKNLNFVSTPQILRGVGNYATEIDAIFSENEKGTNNYQIHGHRNIQLNPVNKYENSFNIEGQIEFGGDLRIVTLSPQGFEFINVKNTVFKTPEHIEMVQDNETFLKHLRKSHDILEKGFGNISSFNFRREVFYSALWSFKNIKARGLFINTNTKEIVARSYDKFFNIGEREETSLEKLETTLKFPITPYIKENGYLGIVGHNKEENSLIFASKSSINTDFARWLKNQFLELLKTEEAVSRIKEHLDKENLSLVFEVVEPVNDPHIIEYIEKKLILIEVVKRTPNFEKLSYEEMIYFAKEYGFEYKKKAKELNNWNEFCKWYEFVTAKDYKYNGDYIEGFVLEDINGFMVKIKLNYYSFWKHMRVMKDNLFKAEKRVIENELAKKFLEWVKTIPQEELKKRDIISLRNEFLSTL